MKIHGLACALTLVASMASAGSVAVAAPEDNTGIAANSGEEAGPQKFSGNAAQSVAKIGVVKTGDDAAHVTAAATASQPIKVAAVEKPAAPSTTLKISIDLSNQRMHVKENGSTIHSWAISSGRSGYPTITGNFRPQWMTRMHYSRKYDNAPMPNSIFFRGGFAIHATYATGMLGRPASHGCVRLSPGNAKQLYALVQRHGRQQTAISIYGSARNASRAVASRKTSKRYSTTSSSNESWWYSGAEKPAKRVSRHRQPKVIYRNGQAYVYVGRERARKYYKQRYSGSYANY